MPATRVKTRWTNGNFEFVDASGNTIATWDGVNRKLTLPAGSVLDVSGGPGILVFPTTANANPVGAQDVNYRIDVADGVTGNVDLVITNKTRVIDVTVVKTGAAGGAGDTITVQNGANAITDAMSINVAQNLVVRCAQIAGANQDIAAAGTLRIVRTKASAANVACTVYVRGLLVP